MSASAGKYLTFFLGAEEYGMEILAVHEIIGVLPITRVPRTPPFVRGVINLRGRVISILDLRRKFDLPAVEPGPTSCIIVVAAHAAHVGLLVDRVSEVADIAPNDIEPPPPLGAGVQTDYLVGIAKSAPRVRLLLDISRVIDAGDVAPAGPPGAPTAA
ncbi:MAG TPA: chemotaxis protein CheW [Gemmatimonadaceae bacterium]|nr:chemotaxis protein CheW [Gemmatimonadaceae bacterium]